MIQALNVVNVYGENESRAGSQRILEAWIRLKDDLDKIKKRGEMILIMGDMNRAIGRGRWGVKGNTPTVSPGGQMIREQLLQTEEFTLLNNLELAKGGPFTWVQPGREKASSCLDLALASANLVPFVASLVIDSKREFTPRRIRKRPNGLEAIYTDHYSLEVKLEGLPGREGGKEKKVSAWNLGKPGGWETYKRLTEEAAPRVKVIAEIEELTADMTMKKVESIENKIKFKAFGKTKPTTQKKQKKNIVISDEELLRKQSLKIEEDITNIKEGKKGRVGQVYNMMKYLGGDKKEGQEPVAIRDPKTKQLIIAPKDIQKVTLQYCVENLSKRKPDKEQEEVKELRQKVHKKRMEKHDNDDFLIDKDDFNEVLRKFSTKKHQDV